MTMKMLLLVSAVALLLDPAVVSPRHIDGSDVVRQNLNRIYDQAENCSTSHKTEVFVEDVSHLAEGRNKCGDKFFCKVHNILNNHEDICDKKNRELLVRTLQMYNNGRHVQCENILQGMTSTGYQIRPSRLLEHVKHCVQHRNFSWTKLQTSS